MPESLQAHQGSSHNEDRQEAISSFLSDNNLLGQCVATIVLHLRPFARSGHECAAYKMLHCLDCHCALLGYMHF